MYSHTQKPGQAKQAPPLKTLGSGIIAQTLPGLTTQQLTALGSNNFGPLNTVSITGVDFGISKSYHPDVKKYEIYESPEDLLALSVAWKRCRDNGTASYNNLLDPSLFKALTHEDQTVADSIRDYYSKKVMMWKLKGTKLTPYREDLNTFVHADGKKFREQVFGLAYYLPEFYSYDVSLDEVRLQIDTNIKPLNETTVKKLTPIKQIVKKNKSATKIQYWLKDIETEGGVLISIDPKNPLEHIWNHLFETKELLSIKGHYYTHDKYDFEYFNVRNWNLALG
jgi:hypothetical protein